LDLTGVDAKLDRAKEHLKALEEARLVFLQGEPYAIEWGQEGHEYVGRAKVNRYPPPRLSTIIGDFLQNLRSALDYTVWELARGEAELPPGQPQFPIFKTCGQFKQNGAWRIRDVPEPQRTLIEDLQPYQRGDDAIVQPLWVLAELSNQDKHRRLTFMGAVAEDASFSISVRHFAITEPVIVPGPFIHGAIIAKFFGLPTYLYSEVNVDNKATFNVVFDPAGLFDNRPVPPFIEVANEVIRVVNLLTDGTRQIWETIEPAAAAQG
jgi:hypothetical protein